MDFNVNEWLSELTEKLLDAFGGRVDFIGLQGSYRRGEATEASDIDLVVILDLLEFDDLKKYKRIIASMPHAEKACGFICGRDELSGWPACDLFQLYYDTKPIHGTLETLIKRPTEVDAIENVRMDATNLYHAVCHTYLYDGADAEHLKPLYKRAFFILASIYFIESGQYVSSKKELLDILEGTGENILEISMNWEARCEQIAQSPDEYFRRLVEWCKSILKKTAEQDTKE